MKDGVLIGIDAGTSVIKSVAFSTTGEQIAAAAIPNRYQTFPDGGAEQDMARTWVDTAATLKELSDKVPNLRDRLIAISVTGQGDGMWLIDKAGEPVAPAWLWLDARSAAITEAFAQSADYPAHYQRTGTGVNACQMSMQLVWMTRNRPDLLARATTGFHCKDWLYFKLTGVRATDPSEGNFTFGQYRTRSYAPDVLDVLGASDAKSLLPEMVEGTQVAGALTPEAAALTGLKAGTPITLGYVDVLCTGLGGGLYDPKGETGCTIVGSTGMHMKIAPSAAHVKLNSELSGYTMCFPVPGMYAQIQSNMASTLNIDWLLDVGRDVLASQGVERSRGDLLKGLDERIMQAEPARAIYHPYISQAGERGPVMEPAARAMFTGLELGMGYADLMRAVFEGLCFASRDCYSAMGEIPREVRVTGGAARSAALRMMLASALKANVRSVQREEAGAAGAAMMAAVQQKLYPDMDACVAEWVNPLLGAVTVPDPSLTARYDGAFGIYKETRETMRPLWRTMVANRAS
ncbi:carbohydrate kinase [Aestuariivirga litoralis]|uniref:Carbohydrate kinase n=1 Tax=Aestuariivirga litoralis TaxID=2650924 RepID=A0A2W2AM69_9HYPH|nr:FGGY-family carbohydrate kinase [Aestuariivirga litoralis]PZF76491.1 carbohydrate kinase [Aestuariivirga litoralis]